jgi:hypothetical protein
VSKESVELVNESQDPPPKSKKKAKAPSSDNEKTTWMYRVIRKFHKQPKNSSDVASSSMKCLNLAQRFKDTFSRKGVRVHFIGAWCIHYVLCAVYHISNTSYYLGIRFPPLGLSEVQIFQER